MSNKLLLEELTQRFGLYKDSTVVLHYIPINYIPMSEDGMTAGMPLYKFIEGYKLKPTKDEAKIGYDGKNPVKLSYKSNRSSNLFYVAALMMMTALYNIQGAQKRIVRLNGLKPGFKHALQCQRSMAKFIGTTTNTISRNMKILYKAGVVEKIDSISTKRKSGTYSNINMYAIDVNGLNDYIIKTYNFDLLNSDIITKEQYKKFMQIIYEDSAIMRADAISKMDKDSEEVQKLVEAYNEYVKQQERAELNRRKKLEATANIMEEFDDDLKFVQRSQPEVHHKFYREGSLRLTNDVCCTVNDIKEEDRTSVSGSVEESVRCKFINMTLFNSGVDAFKNKSLIEIDKNGSIYRLTKHIGDFVNKFEGSTDFDNIMANLFTLPECDDIYEYIFMHTDFYDKNTWDSCTRTLIKQIFMPTYMKESAINYTAAMYEAKKHKVERFGKIYAKQHNIDISECTNIEDVIDISILHDFSGNYLFKTDDELTSYMYYRTLEDRFGVDIKTLRQAIRKALHEVLNTRSFENYKIFVYESIVHILVLKHFIQRGVNVINVYDGFYFEADSGVTVEYFNKVYNEAVVEMLIRLRKSGKLDETKYMPLEKAAAVKKSNTRKYNKSGKYIGVAKARAEKQAQKNSSNNVTVVPKTRQQKLDYSREVILDKFRTSILVCNAVCKDIPDEMYASIVHFERMMDYKILLEKNGDMPSYLELAHIQWLQDSIAFRKNFVRHYIRKAVSIITKLGKFYGMEKEAAKLIEVELKRETPFQIPKIKSDKVKHIA